MRMSSPFSNLEGCLHSRTPFLWGSVICQLEPCVFWLLHQSSLNDLNVCFQSKGILNSRLNPELELTFLEAHSQTTTSHHFLFWQTSSICSKMLLEYDKRFLHSQLWSNAATRIHRTSGTCFGRTGVRCARRSIGQFFQQRIYQCLPDHWSTRLCHGQHRLPTWCQVSRV